MISKTPYSATISLKSSFVKHFSETQSEPRVDNFVTQEIDSKEIKTLKHETSKLRARIAALENVVDEQKVVIEEKFK